MTRNFSFPEVNTKVKVPHVYRMEEDQVPENDVPCSIKDDVIYLVRDWESISKDRSLCSKEKLLCINNLEKITATFEGSTSTCEENLKPLLNIMVCFALLFTSLAINYPNYIMI